MSATEMLRQQVEFDRAIWRSGRGLDDLSLPQLFAELVGAERLSLGEGRSDSAILRGLTQLRRLKQRAHGRALTWQDALQVDGLLQAYSSASGDLDVVLRETLRHLAESDPAINDLILAWQDIQPNPAAASVPTHCEAA